MRYFESHETRVKRNQRRVLWDNLTHKGHNLTIDGKEYFLFHYQGSKFFYLANVEARRMQTGNGFWKLADAIDYICETHERN